jgi:hypothetical protein
MNDIIDADKRKSLDIEDVPAAEFYKKYRRILNDDDAVDVMWADGSVYIGRDGAVFDIDRAAGKDAAFDGLGYNAMVNEILGSEPCIVAYLWNEDDDDCKDRDVLYFGLDTGIRPSDEQIKSMARLADRMKGPYAAKVGLYMIGANSCPMTKDIDGVVSSDGMRAAAYSAYTLREDGSDSDTLDLDVGASPVDVGEICVAIGGEEVFSDEGEESLKASGNLRDGALHTYDDDGEHKMSLYELAGMIPYESFSWTFPKALLLSAFDRAYPEGMKDVRMRSDDFEPGRDMSRDFIEHLLSCDLDDQFYYDSGDSDYYHVGDIDDSVKARLEEYGFPKDIYERIKAGPSAEEFSDDRHQALKDAYQFASEDAMRRGAEDACVADFDKAVDDATPRGVEMRRDYDNGELIFDVTREFVGDYADKIWDIIANDVYYNDDAAPDGDTLADAVPKSLIDMFNNYFEFREPYYGWEGFDEETFNDSLSWRIDDAMSSLDSSSK